MAHVRAVRRSENWQRPREERTTSLRGLIARLQKRRYSSGDWLLALAGVLVAVCSVTVAELAREDAQRHLRAVALVETIRASSQQLSAITAQALAYSFEGRSPRLEGDAVTRGFIVWDALEAAETKLQAVAPSSRSALLAHDAVALYAAGTRALGEMRSSGLRSGLRAEQHAFQPALDRINLDGEGVAAFEQNAADSASTRAVVAFVGSLTAGLIALLLLGWRLAANRRNRLLAAQRQVLEENSEARIRALLEHSNDVVSVLGPDLNVRWQAPSVHRLLGHDPASLIGRPLTAIVLPGDRQRVAEFLRASRQRFGPRAIIARLPDTSGRCLHIEMIAGNRIGDPAVNGIVVSMRDVTEMIAWEHDLQHRAFHDPLTGLANRALFEDHLTQAMARLRRDRRPFAVLFLDLDDFKSINDSFGHARGDELLRKVAMRLADVLRPTDTAARLGGDEFGVLVEFLNDGDEAHLVARRILDAFRLPFMLGAQQATVTTSIGVTICNGLTDIEQLMRDADAAMYVAKRQGKALMQDFEPGMRVASG